MICLKSHAKVNLSLDVLAKRPQDGYHYVQMVMIPIGLFDTVSIQNAPDIYVTCMPPLDCPIEANLAYRAALMLRSVTGYRGGALIHIEKRIPLAGGLAGGSANAAAVLNGLNQLWGIGLSEAELGAIAIRLGSDVPFFVSGRPARVEGIGERLTPIHVQSPFWLVLCTPAVMKSTANVYRLFDQLESVERVDTRGLEQALATGDIPEIANRLGNVFEQVMLPRHPEIMALKRAMLEGGALGALMSGAGPSVFGIVANQKDGLELAAGLRRQWPRTWLVQTEG